MRHSEPLERMQGIADRVGGEVHHAGGNVLNVRVRDPRFPRQTFDFGTESGELVGYDRCIDGEYMGSGDLPCEADAPVEDIADAILRLIGARNRVLG